MNRRLGLCVAIGVVVAGGIGLAQSPAPIDYETFCKIPDMESKRSAFMATTAENRATLIRTQLERWRDANKAKLKPEQIASLADLIAAITPDTYKDGPEGEAQRIKSHAVIEKQNALFTPAEIQAMQPSAGCIAKSK
jgi:hypothetical protein